MTGSEKTRFVDRIKTIEERLLMIVNPMSKKGSEIASRVRSLIRREGMNLEETSTDHPDDVGATMEFWSKRFGGSRIIMVFGGDGAVNQVINNVMLSRSNKNVVLVPIPAGTANDFCRALRLDTVENSLEAMVEFNIRPIDLIRLQINGTNGSKVRYCSNIIGVGLDGDIARASQKYKRFGILGYWYASIKTAVISLFGGVETWRVRITSQDFEYEGALCNLMLSNIDRYGHDLLVAPGAQPDDGKIHGVIAKPMGTIRAVTSGLLLVKGMHARMSTVLTFDCEEVQVELLDDIYGQEDGEVFFYPRGTVFNLSMEKSAINVLSPSPSLTVNP